MLLAVYWLSMVIRSSDVQYIFSRLRAFSKVKEPQFSKVNETFRNLTIEWSGIPVFVSLKQEYKKSLDEKHIIRAAFIDLPKAFDCNCHNLLIENFYTYMFSEDALIFLYFY